MKLLVPKPDDPDEGEVDKTDPKTEPSSGEFEFVWGVAEPVNVELKVVGEFQNAIFT